MTAELHRIAPTNAPAAEPEASFPEALLRLPSVIAMTGISRTEIYRRIEDGTFPRPVVLGPNSVAWKQSDLLQWIAELPVQPAPEHKRLPIKTRAR